MNDFRRICRYALPYTPYIVKSFLCNGLYALFSVFTLGMIVPFVSLLFGLVKPIYERPQFSLSSDGVMNTLSYYITYFQTAYGMFSALLFISAIFIFCSLASNMFRFLGMFYLSPVNANTTRDLRRDLFDKILTLPLSFYTQTKTGDLLIRFNDDLNEIDSALIRVSIDVFLRQPLMIIFFVTALIMVSPWLMLMSVVTFPLMIWITRKISLTIKRKAKQRQEELSGIAAIYEESISGLRIIKGFAAQNYFKEKFAVLNRRYTRSMNKVIRFIELSPPASEILAIAGLMLVLLVGSVLLLRGKGLSADAMILFLILFARLISPIHTCIRGWGYIQKGLVSARRVFEILDCDISIIEKENARPIHCLNDGIICQNVSFGYIPEQTVLHGIDLELKKGETVALVGNSGGGKSTLINLLLRFYDVTDGQILIDGFDMRDYRPADVRRLFGLVSQDVLLFNDTIEANIGLGVESYTREAVEQAARIANAHDFIMEMPQGYQTIIGDRGGKLSGGQRQRLSIARAVMMQPSVFLLDEATSSLDSQSEQAVEQALDNLMSKSTCFVIAHRLSTVRNADRIIVLKEGRIVEQGNHNQLLNLKGEYSRLVALQKV